MGRWIEEHIILILAWLASLFLSFVFLLISYYVMGPHTGHESLAWEFWRVFTHEVGFALLVASLIWLCFEVFKNYQSDGQWNQRIEKISKNVFFGVYKRNFPEGFIREANRLVIDQKFVRSTLSFVYTISDAHYPSREDKSALVPFVKLGAVAKYRVKNISDADADYTVGIMLPNPMIDEMKTFCRVNRVAIKDGGPGKDPFPLDAAEQQFRQDLNDDSKSAVPFKVGTIKIKPGEEVEIITDYVMAKEDEDTEVVQTLYPTESVNLTIMDRGPTRRLVRARSLHIEPLEDNTPMNSEGTYNFKVDHFFLPHQGFVIWWKKNP